MSENKQQSASDIAREAKGINQGLQEALKSREIWERDVEFQRKDLRRRYVRLLLAYPFAKESKDAETRLWMQTSYTFIAIYKNRISRVDPNGPPKGPRQNRRDPQGGIVEYRKLLSRFRQFLAEEEKFWIQLVVRLRRLFALDEVHPILLALELVPPDAEDTLAIHEPENGARGHNLFPAEDADFLSSTPEQRNSQLSIVSKALVCLGDIARYREQYNEKGGRPKAGQEIGPPARKNGKKQKAEQIPRSRDYEKAQQRYEQARFLVPTEGHPSHQLAILSSYQRDTFGSLVHYYRALCVQQPFETAVENMEKALSKSLDYWKSSVESRAAQHPPTAPRVRIDNLKDRIVVLHAYWATGNEDIERGLPGDIPRLFKDLVSERLLPIETVWKIVLLTQGALWKNRMLRSPNSKKTSNSAIEAQMATHLLVIHRVLLEVGIEELGEAPPEDSEFLAQNITATFRRTLPALRMASKWIRANFKYFSRDDTRALSIKGLAEYWDTYVRFSTAMERRFPLKSLKIILDNLNSAKGPLEEDLEVNGFLPLSKLMSTGWNSLHAPEVQIEGESHPNDEQIMRLWDLSTDARVIAENQDSPITFSGTSFFMKGNEPPEDTIEESQTALETESIRTDDDPVSDAFKKVLLEGSEDDDDEEQDEIVWDPRAPASSPHNFVSKVLPSLPPPVTHPTSSNSPILIKPAHVSSKQPASLVMPKPAGTTAQDLLNNVMGLSMKPNEHLAESASLFAPNGLNGSSHSIWSPSLDDPKYTAVNSHHQRSRSQYAAPGSPYVRPQLPLGSSPAPWQQLGQSSQGFGIGTPSSPFVPQPYPIGHQRTQSTALPSAYGPQYTHHRVESLGFNQPPAQNLYTATPGTFSNPPPIAGIGGSPTYSTPATRQGFSPVISTSSYGLPPPTNQHIWGHVG